MTDSIQDIAGDVASRYLNRGDTLAKALVDIGYGDLVPYTRSFDIDLADGHGHVRWSMNELTQALIPVIQAAMKRAGKTAMNNLESVWGKVAFNPHGPHNENRNTNMYNTEYLTAYLSRGQLFSAWEFGHALGIGESILEKVLGDLVSSRSTPWLIRKPVNKDGDLYTRYGLAIPNLKGAELLISELKRLQGKVAFDLDSIKPQYKTLNDAAAATGDPKYGPGHTQVWYVKPAMFRDLIMGYEFVAEHFPLSLPDPRNLHKTHVLVGVLNVTSPGQVYHQMQGEMWSPQGEARSMIQGLGLQHTSMSVGDIIVEGSDVLMVDTHGFKKLVSHPSRQASVNETALAISLGNGESRPVQDFVTALDFPYLVIEEILAKWAVSGHLQVRGEGLKKRYFLTKPSRQSALQLLTTLKREIPA